MSRGEKISRSKVKDLHEKGLKDPEIAERLNCTASGIRYVRRELGLKPNWSISRDRVRELHARGLNDCEIAEKFKRPRQTVWYIRKKVLGLESNWFSRVKVSRDKVRELHEKGLSDTKIAERLNRPRGSVSRIRKELGLKSNWFVSRDRVKELYDSGLSDYEMAEELNCAPQTIQMVRSELGLKEDRPSWEDIDHDEFWRDYMSGMPLGKLAEKYGYASEQSIRRVIGRIYLERKNE